MDAINNDGNQNYVCVNCGWVIVDDLGCLEFDGAITIDTDFDCDAECPLCRATALFPTADVAVCA